MFSGFGAVELIIILAIVILFFGGSKFKELARGLGESTKEVKKIKKEISKGDKEKDEE